MPQRHKGAKFFALLIANGIKNQNDFSIHEEIKKGFSQNSFG